MIEKLHRIPAELDIEPAVLDRAMADWSAEQARHNAEAEKAMKQAEAEAKRG